MFLDQPDGSWHIGVCRGPRYQRILKGVTKLGDFYNKFNCLERCGVHPDVTGCEFDKATSQCKAHTEPVYPRFVFGKSVCFVFQKYIN